MKKSTKENLDHTSTSLANSVSQKKSKTTTSPFVDNRQTTIAQRQLQTVANNSPQALQLKAFQDAADNRHQTVQQDTTMDPVQRQALRPAPTDRFDVVQRSDIFDGVDDLAHQQDDDSDSDVEEFELVSVKEISPDGVPALEGPANAWGIDKDFGDMGLIDDLQSIEVRRPRQGGTHYEVNAIVGGVRVKLDLTINGYRMIYNANEASNQYYQDSNPVPVQGKTGRDLYESFLALTMSLGKYNGVTNDCQNFAQSLVDDITAVVNQDDDDDSDGSFM